MKKTLLSYLPLLCALACSSPSAAPTSDDLLAQADETGFFDPLAPDFLAALADEQGELGQVAEAFGAKNTFTYQYGTRTSTNRSRCDGVSSGQVCSVPGGTGLTGTAAAKSATWRFTPFHGLTSAEQTAVTNAMTVLDNTLSAWSLPFTTASSGVLQFAKASATGASTSNNIDAFVHNSFDVVNELDEGAGVDGHYQTHTGCVIRLDIDDINARGGTATEIGILRTHAILSGAMKCLGLGMRDDATSANTYIDRTLVIPGPLFRPLMTAGDQCQANSYDPFSTQGSFDIINPGCNLD